MELNTKHFVVFRIFNNANLPFFKTNYLSVNQVFKAIGLIILNL
jgi:hypothetical protein